MSPTFACTNLLKAFHCFNGTYYLMPFDTFE